MHVRFERANRLHLQVIEKSLGAREDRHHLQSDAHRLILPLLQNLDEAATAIELRLRDFVEIGAELRERGKLAILRKVETQRASNCAHGANLRRTADARNRDADVDCRPNAGVKQIRFEVDLAVGDRDDVRRNVRGDVARLRLDDRQRGQRSTALFVTELRRALEESRVQVKHVARVRLPAGRAAEQQRDFSIRLRVLRQIVVDAERVLLVVQEVFPHRASAIRREILQRRRLGRRRADDNRVLHRAVVLEGFHDLRDGRFLLTDRDVNADDAFPLLIDDRVDGYRRLAGLSIANDQLALASADRNHRVDRFQSGLQRLLHRLSIDDAGCDALDAVILGSLYRTLSIDRNAERIDYPPDHRGTDGHGHDASSALHLVALFDHLIFAEENDADVVLFEVRGETDDVVRELHELAGHDAIEAVHARDAVANSDHSAYFGDIHGFPDASQLLPNDLCDFFSF